jgi:hypothetical protein
MIPDNAPALLPCLPSGHPVAGYLRSSKLSPNGPSVGRLCLRNTVTAPVSGFRIVAVALVITGLPCNNQQSPVASYLDSRR